MIGSSRAAPQESWETHKGVKTGQNKGAVVSGVWTYPHDRRGESVFHRGRKRKLDPMHLPKTCWTQCVSSAVPLTRYENRGWSVSITRPLPEAAHHTGSAFKSFSLRVFFFFFFSFSPSRWRTERKNSDRLISGVHSGGGAPLVSGNLPVEDLRRPTQSRVLPP